MTGEHSRQRPPMFPLGTVLLPGVLLPMQVFEPRYKALVADVAESNEPGFGVVLIERGSEVGGGDTRRPVGTFGRIVLSRETDDGRWMIVVVGTDRIVVHEWLDDDPYPVAMVERHRLGPPDMTDGEYQQVMALTRQVLAARAELDQPSAPVTREAPEAIMHIASPARAALLQ